MGGPRSGERGYRRSTHRPIVLLLLFLLLVILFLILIVILLLLLCLSRCQIAYADLELLSYIHALVYHDRAGRERRGLQAIIDASVQTDRHRREVQAMERTIAQELQEEGRRKGLIEARKQTLLRQLRLRFGDVPKAVTADINGCTNVRQLVTWLDNFATANALADVGINGPS